jgi:hypothetical protein
VFSVPLRELNVLGYVASQFEKISTPSISFVEFKQEFLDKGLVKRIVCKGHRATATLVTGKLRTACTHRGQATISTFNSALPRSLKPT